MRVKEYQMDELARARALQDEAAKLHIPVPVLSYQYEIADADGNIEEKGIGKSNSYTRNGLNSIAYFAGLSDVAIDAGDYTDGTTMCKRPDGSTESAFNMIKRPYSSTNFSISLGTSDDAESLDSYEIPSSGLTNVVSSRASTFNTVSRKLITTHTASFKNNTASTINITESGVAMPLSYPHSLFYIRDVFTAIPVEPGKTITWTYVTEVSYPEP